MWRPFGVATGHDTAAARCPLSTALRIRQPFTDGPFRFWWNRRRFASFWNPEMTGHSMRAPLAVM